MRKPIPEVITKFIGLIVIKKHQQREESRSRRTKKKPHHPQQQQHFIRYEWIFEMASNSLLFPSLGFILFYFFYYYYYFPLCVARFSFLAFILCYGADDGLFGYDPKWYVCKTLRHKMCMHEYIYVQKRTNEAEKNKWVNATGEKEKRAIHSFLLWLCVYRS